MRTKHSNPQSTNDTDMHWIRPRYIKGHSINLGALVLIIITTIITMMYVKIENSKRERGVRDHRLAEEDAALLGYRHPSFRYTM